MLIEEITIDLSKRLNDNINSVILDRIKENGFDHTDLVFIKNNFKFIAIEGYMHLYYHFGQPDGIRIISIQTTPIIDFAENFDVSKNSISINAQMMYY